MLQKIILMIVMKRKSREQVIKTSESESVKFMQQKFALDYSFFVEGWAHMFVLVLKMIMLNLELNCASSNTIFKGSYRRKKSV